MLLSICKHGFFFFSHSCEKRVQVSCICSWLKAFTRKESLCMPDFPARQKLRKANFFNLNGLMHFKYKIGIDPLRSGGGTDGGGWADNKGQRRCVLHSFIPSLKETNIRWFTLLRSRENVGLDATRNTSKRRQTAPASSPNPRTVITWGEETVCVLEEEMLILVLILKGPDRSMALSSLWKREINMFFKGEAGCMWLMRVGFIDTTRRV